MMTSPFKHFLERIRQAPGHEHEQALIRLIIGLSVFCYIAITHLGNLSVIYLVAAEILLYTAAAIGIFAWIAINPRSDRTRYIFSNIIDITGLSYALYLGNEIGAALYPLYLWVTFGFGFRFGRLHLAISATLSIIGFIVVYLYSNYWHQHNVLYTGLLGGLILLPLYVSTLLTRLKKAIDHAEIANRAKSEFLANMSHEIRTPLNGIVGANDLLKSLRLNKDQYEYTEAIDYSAKSLLSLIDNILDISKIEEGKIEIHHDIFDLHQLLNNVIRMFKSHANIKGLALKLHIDANVPFALIGDHNKLRQILFNLIGNAIKFTETGGVTVTVSLSTELPADSSMAQLRFQISDTGIGIKQDEQSRIFERFHQVDNSETRRYSGSGLGTTIAKQLVELMKGKINLDSVYGEGSTFYFSLPFETQPAKVDYAVSLKSLHVIVITDIGRRLLNIVEYTKSWGITVHDFTSVETALEYMRTTPHQSLAHAFIIAKSSYDIDAENTVAAIRRQDAFASAKLIIIEDVIEEKRQATLLKYGYDYVLAWPLDKKQLYNALHSSPALHFDADNVVFISEQAPNYAQQKFRVLVAEDNITNQKIIAHTLTKAGHLVKVANNGDEALDILENDQFDLCIVDMHMPVLGGIQTVQQFRLLYPDNKMPFIMLTANVTTDAIARCREVGVDQYMTKPVRPNDLLNAIVGIVKPLTVPKPDLINKNAINTDSPNLPEAVNIESIQYYLDDEEYFNDLVTSFIKDGQLLLRDLSQAVEQKQYVTFKDTAHTFKSPAGSLGANQLYKLLNVASRMSKERFTDEGADLADQITHAFHRAQFALWRIAHKLKSVSDSNDQSPS